VQVEVELAHKMMMTMGTPMRTMMRMISMMTLMMVPLQMQTSKWKDSGKPFRKRQ
jgi:hypothetical protein